MYRGDFIYFIAGAGVTMALWLVAYIFVFERTLNKQHTKIMILKRKLTSLEGRLKVYERNHHCFDELYLTDEQ